MLDAVADGLLPPTGDLVVLVCIWIDPAAFDETAVRTAARAAVRKALGVARERPRSGRRAGAGGAARSVTSPFYGGS